MNGAMKRKGNGLLSGIGALLLGLLATGRAEVLEAYDPLARNNLSLRTNLLSSGSAVTKRGLETDYGTYSRDLETEKILRVEIPVVPREFSPPKIEAYALLKNHETKKWACTPGEIVQQSDGGTDFRFSAKNRRERWMYAEDGRVSQFGDKILGWVVRAIVDNRIVGVAASSDKYLTYAKNPKELQTLLGSATGGAKP